MVLYGFFFWGGGSTKSKVLQSKRIHRYEYEHKSNTLHSAIMCIFININHLELVCIEVSFCVDEWGREGMHNLCNIRKSNSYMSQWCLFVV